MKPTSEDALILQELQTALDEAHLVPDFVAQAGYGAFAWQGIDAELAQLLFDSAQAELASAGVRADPRASLRAMTFATADTTIELEIHITEVLGQVSPVRGDRLWMLPKTGQPSAHDLDDLGCFALPMPAEGEFRLRIEGVVTTPWISLE